MEQASLRFEGGPKSTSEHPASRTTRSSFLNVTARFVVVVFLASAQSYRISGGQAKQKVPSRFRSPALPGPWTRRFRHSLRPNCRGSRSFVLCATALTGCGLPGAKPRPARCARSVRSSPNSVFGSGSRTRLPVTCRRVGTGLPPQRASLDRHEGKGSAFWGSGCSNEFKIT